MTLEIERTDRGFNISGLEYTVEEAMYIADWIVTMVDPVIKLKQMYITDIVNYKKDGTTREDTREDNQTDSADKQDKVGLTG